MTGLLAELVLSLISASAEAMANGSLSGHVFVLNDKKLIKQLELKLVARLM